MEKSKESTSVEGGFFCGGWNFSKSVRVGPTFIREMRVCTKQFPRLKEPEPFRNLLPLSIASLNSTNCAKVLLLMSSLSMHILNNDTKQRNLWRDETKTAKIPGHLTHLLQ